MAGAAALDLAVGLPLMLTGGALATLVALLILTMLRRRARQRAAAPRELPRTNRPAAALPEATPVPGASSAWREVPEQPTPSPLSPPAAPVPVADVAPVAPDASVGRPPPAPPQPAATPGPASVAAAPTAVPAIVTAPAEDGAGVAARLAAAEQALAEGRLREAETEAKAAIHLAMRLRLKEPHAAARLVLGDVAYRGGDLTTACEHWQMARSLFHELSQRARVTQAESRMLPNGCPTDWVLNDF